MVSAANKRDSTDEPEVVFMLGERASLKRAKMASPPEGKEKWACPISECWEPGPPIGKLEGVQRSVSDQEAEDAQGAEPLRMLLRGLQRLELGATGEPASSNTIC